MTVNLLDAGALFQPFRGLLAAPESAAAVAAPPYDVVNRAEAGAHAAGRPASFLHVSRAEIDLDDSVDAHDDAVYARAAANFGEMISGGTLVRDAAPAFYIWRLEIDGHTQSGVVAAASTAGYEAGRIKRHEFTRPDKETDRVRHMEALSAATGPTLLAHRPDAALAGCIDGATAGEPHIDITGPGDVRHTLWRVADADAMAALGAALAGLPAAYIADGHHRTAAACRVAEARGIADGRFLSVLFPSDQLTILDYNRVVKDLAGLTPEAFLARLGETFHVQLAAEPTKPSVHHHIGLYLGDQWYALALHDAVGADTDPVAALDVAVLSSRILEPILGIMDPRTDPRIDFVGGVRGLAGLEARVASGDWAAAFALFPTAMDELMSVADGGNVMPPKSTWFEPKLADGLVSLVLD